jgi:hypothetical protein
MPEPFCAIPVSRRMAVSARPSDRAYTAAKKYRRRSILFASIVIRGISVRVQNFEMLGNVAMLVIRAAAAKKQA